MRSRPQLDGSRSQTTQRGSKETSATSKNERVVSIDTIFVASGNIKDITQVKERLQQSIDSYKLVQGTKVQKFISLGTLAMLLNRRRTA